MSAFLAAHQPCHCEVHKVMGDLVVTEGEKEGEFRKGLKNNECSSVFKKILTAYLSFESA